MATRFNGIINVDIGDSVPDWTPFEPPKAPHDAPNVKDGEDPPGVATGEDLCVGRARE